MSSLPEPRPVIIKVDAANHSRDVYSIHLNESGFQVIRAASIKDGIKVARRAQPDLILVIDNPARGIDAAHWLETQHSDTEVNLAMVPLFIIASADRVERLRVHELPDRVKVFEQSLNLQALSLHAHQLLAMWGF